MDVWGITLKKPDSIDIKLNSLLILIWAFIAFSIWHWFNVQDPMLFYYFTCAVTGNVVSLLGIASFDSLKQTAMTCLACTMIIMTGLLVFSVWQFF